MDDKKPLKRSEQLAVENVRRIAEQLRSERNDALALAQTKNEEAERARRRTLEAAALLKEARPLLLRIDEDAARQCAERIDAWLQSDTV